MNLSSRRRMFWISGLALFLGGLLTVSLPAFGDDDGDGDKEALKKLETIENKIKRACKENDNGQVIALLKEAGALQIPKAVDVITKYGFFHPDVAVFEAAKNVLGELRKESVVAHIIDEVLKGDRIEVRIGLTDVLEKIPGPKTEDALIEVLKEKDRRIRQPAARVLGARHSKKAIPPLIKILEDTEGERDVVWDTIRQALTDITGEDFSTATEWQSWWDTAGEKFDPTKSRGKKEKAGFETEERPKFFSEPVASKRIMFIIDVSGSMHIKDPISGGETDDGSGAQGGAVGECKECGQQHPGVDLPEARKRIERVKRELAGVVKQLKGNVRFNIICFSDKMQPWQNQITLAAPAGKSGAFTFVNKFQAMGGTHTDEALQMAFKDKNINTIFLLSDGAPFRFPKGGMGQGSPIPTDGILKEVRSMNRFRKIKIYTFGFDNPAYPDNGEYLGFLQKLAEENRGKFTAIK